MKRSIIPVALAVLFVVALGACGGGGGSNEPGTDLVGIDTAYESAPTDVAVEVGTDVPACTTKLVFVDGTDDLGKPTASASVFNITMSYTTSRDLKVKLECGTRVTPNASITFEKINETVQSCQLAAGTVYTDENGLATDKLTNVDSKIEQFQVKVSDADDTGVAPLYFNVSVSPKGAPPLTVGFADYKGSYLVDQAEVRLFKLAANGKPKCADLPLDQIPKTQAAVTSPTFAVDGTYSFVTLPALDTDLTQTYTIVGLAKHGSGATQAWACDDTDGTLEYGKTKYVELTLKDITPKLTGSYDLTSTFDLVSGLPQNVKVVVDAITGFFQNPTGEILLLACTLGGGNATLQTFCGYVFQDPANPDVTKLTGTGDIAAQIINALLIGIIEANCPDKTDPTMCSKIYWTGKDVSDILTKFQILSTLTFSAEPDTTTGAVKGKEVWHSVRLRWTLGKSCPPTDPDCGWQKFSFSQIPGIDDTINADFDATVAPAWTLSIAKHKLNMKYGALINFAIEKWVLPKLFGDGTDGLPAVDCYGAMIGSLVAGKSCLQTSDCCSATGTCSDCCTQFAQNLVNQAGGSLTATAISGACGALIQVGQKYLRDKLTGLDATPDNFEVGTKAPCAIYDANADMRFDTIGKQDKQCDWDTGLTIGTYTYAPTGTFYGIAK